MDRILIDVYLPADGEHYDIRLPGTMNCLMAAHLTARALSELSEGAYLPSRTSVFAWRESGRLLSVSRSLEQEQVKNGSQLMLI